MKGRHNDENDKYMLYPLLNIKLTRQQHSYCIELGNDLQWNGTMFFFAMAAADKALKGYETLDDFIRARLPRGRDSWTLEWKDDACERPVLRMACASGIDETRALTFAAL